jgi:tRNA modification GTPase
VEVADRLTEAEVLASGREAPAELLAESLRGALDRIGELVGRIDPDDVLGRVFATFCVGK